MDLSSPFADEQFKVVTETMVDGLIVIDAIGVIRYVNPSCEKLFLYEEGALLGKNVSTLMPSPFAEAHDGYLARHREAKVQGIVGSGRELKGLKSDGTVFPMYLSVGESSISGSIRFIGIIYDLTEKKRAEELILHHQKLDAIGQLSGGIAHDFNNILSVIGGNLEIASAQDQTPSSRRALARAQEVVERAVRITQRLLAFARRQPLSSEPTDINAALNNLSDMLRRAIGETILVVEDDPDVCLVTVSRLEKLGYRIVVASDGATALKVVQSEPEIRLGLLDVVMPGGMDGHRLADQIEKIAPDIRLVLMSGYSAKMAAGLDEPDGRPFLSKPVSLLKLARTIRNVLKHPR